MVWPSIEVNHAPKAKASSSKSGAVTGFETNVAMYDFSNPIHIVGSKPIIPHLWEDGSPWSPQGHQFFHCIPGQRSKSSTKESPKEPPKVAKMHMTHDIYW